VRPEDETSRREEEHVQKGRNASATPVAEMQPEVSCGCDGHVTGRCDRMNEAPTRGDQLITDARASSKEDHTSFALTNDS
jgi:hypothetical protein